MIKLKRRVFVAAGAAVVSPERFKLIGRWGIKPRNISVHGETIKRTLVCAENYREACFSRYDEAAAKAA